LPKAPSAKLAEPKTDKTEEPRIKRTKTLEVLSPSVKVTMPKAQKGLVATPKRKRMASVLDVLETVKASSSTTGKIAKALKVQIEAKTKLTGLASKLGLQSLPRRNPRKLEKRQRRKRL
jgi:hypothetical protein